MADFNEDYYIDIDPVLSLIERAQKRARHPHLYPAGLPINDGKRIAIGGLEGCLKGAEDVGAYLLLAMRGILQEADGYVGGSVNGVTAYCLPDFQKGIQIFPFLLQHHFMRLWKSNAVNFIKIAMPEITRRMPAVVHDYFPPPVNDGVLNEALETFGPTEDTLAMKRYCAVTNARTGHKELILLTGMPLDEARRWVIAGSHMEGIAGEAPVIDGIPWIDSAFGIEQTTDKIVDLGYTDLLLPCSSKTHEFSEMPSGQRKVFTYFISYHNPDAGKVFDTILARGGELINEMRNEARVTTPAGNRANVTLLQVSETDKVLRHTEDDPVLVRDGMIAGFKRCAWLMNKCEYQVRDHEWETGIGMIRRTFEPVIAAARPTQKLPPPPLPETMKNAAIA